MQAIPRYLIASVAALAVAACGDGTSPGDSDNRAAARFDELADSLAGGGDYARADALRHAAVIVRLTGAPTPVTLTIDGAVRRFVAVAEELEYPNLVCSWPGDTGGISPDPDGTPPDTFPPPPLPPHEPPMPPREPPVCEPAGTHRMRALIAWEPDRMEEVVRLVADEGRGAVQPGIPDPMAGPTHEGEGWGGSERPDDPPPPASPDSTVTSPPFYPGPGFMGEYLDRATGFWWSVSGSQANSLEREGGSCRSDEVEFDWARYACSALTVRFEFSMRVQRVLFIPVDGSTPRDPPVPPLVETRDIALQPASVNGARLTLLEWLPPPPPVEPPPFPRPLPPDSAWTEPAGDG